MTMNERLICAETSLARVETRLDNIDERTKGIETKVSEIHEVVVSTSTDNKWTKRLIIFLVFAIIGGTITLGFNAIGDGSGIAAAQTHEAGK
jgi:hypothetical protein